MCLCDHVCMEENVIKLQGEYVHLMWMSTAADRFSSVIGSLLLSLYGIAYIQMSALNSECT